MCVYAYFVSVGSDSIVSHFDCEICSQVAVPQSQITERGQDETNQILYKFTVTKYSQTSCGRKIFS